jgi:hypothetical protein
MRSTGIDVTTFATDVIKKTEKINKALFRVCKLTRKKRNGMIILGITLIAGLIWLIDKS